MNRILLTLTATAVVTAFSWLTISAGYPTLWAPINFLVLGPTWLAEPLGRVAIVVGLMFVPLSCVLWCLPIFKGAPDVPVRSLVLFALAISLSALNLVMGYEYSLRWQGRPYAIGVVLISILMWSFLASLAWLAWRRRTPALNNAFHISLFAWLAWYSLPTLGELP
jgi:hypothetical protein